MRKLATVIFMTMISPAAGLLVFIGLLVLDAIRAMRQRAARGPFARIKPSAEQRTAFEGRLQEHEFRIASVGPTILPEAKR